MTTLFEDLQNIPYASGKEHEYLVKQVLDKHSISYKEQPNGGSKFPDFRVYTNNGTSFNIECKSSNTANAPMYNDTPPQKNTLYVFTSRKHGTVLYMGDEINFEQHIFEQYKRELHDLAVKYNQEYQHEVLYGFRPSVRTSISNYYTHGRRDQWEQNVKQYLSCI